MESKKVDLNQKVNEGYNALYIACETDNIEAVRMLLEY